MFQELLENSNKTIFSSTKLEYTFIMTNYKVRFQNISTNNNQKKLAILKITLSYFLHLLLTNYHLISVIIQNIISILVEQVSILIYLIFHSNLIILSILGLYSAFLRFFIGKSLRISQKYNILTESWIGGDSWDSVSLFSGLLCSASELLFSVDSLLYAFELIFC